MANFGTHFSYPQPPRPTDSGVMFAVETERAAKSAGSSVARFARRAFNAIFRAVDEAPFDLAWPPSPRAYTRNYLAMREGR